MESERLGIQSVKLLLECPPCKCFYQQNSTLQLDLTTARTNDLTTDSSTPALYEKGRKSDSVLELRRVVKSGVWRQQISRVNFDEEWAGGFDCGIRPNLTRQGK